jgi:hypothetical protein
VIGVGESLANVALAMVMLVMAWIATSVGAYRSGSQGSATLHDPHAR